MPYATITDIETGEIVQRLGPFDCANQARLACGQFSGQVLRWEITGPNWESRTNMQAFRVPRDSQPDESKPLTENPS